VEAADEEPEELVPSPKAWTMPGAEGDLELRTEEQVLDEEALAPAEDAGGVARTSSRSSIIGGRIADRCSPRGGAQTFALLQPSVDFSSRNVPLASEVIGDDTTRSE
jgi:hypothetical protein